MPTQRELHKDIDELRERYQNLTHRSIRPFRNESRSDFERRQHRWLERQKRIQETIAHLRAKARARGRKRSEAKQRKDGLAEFDGVTVAAWMVEWLKKSRARGWAGTVVSGWRDPEYSESLCLNMCGAPTCPGKCAGKLSNHSGSEYPYGAIDVTDFTNFERIQYEIGSPLRNDLPVDPVHFSVSGH